MEQVEQHKQIPKSNGTLKNIPVFWWVVLSCLVIWGGYSIFSEDRSIATTEQQLLVDLNNGVSNLNHPDVKVIESWHLMVTAKKAQVNKVSITTLNGKDDTGKNGSNIKTIYYELEIWWDGWVHKNRKTVVGILCSHNELIDFNLIYTDAPITRSPKNIEVFKDGFHLGKAIAPFPFLLLL